MIEFECQELWLGLRRRGRLARKRDKAVVQEQRHFDPRSFGIRLVIAGFFRDARDNEAESPRRSHGLLWPASRDAEVAGLIVRGRRRRQQGRELAATIG